MGSDPAAEHAPDPDESPAHRVACEAFRIGRTPVTNADYRRFVEATGHPPPTSWPRGGVPEGRDLHPVTYVSWLDATAFCRWTGGFLPTEAQWERAARGGDGRTWPWGDGPPTAECAVFAGLDTAPVGSRAAGAGPFGSLDLAGNVWEWTASALRPYPYAADGGGEAAPAEPRVVRGGAFIHGPGQIRCSYRHGMLPGAVDHYVGLRLASAPSAPLAPGMEMVDVPAGEVLLGNDPRLSRGPAPPDEVPRHVVAVPAFLLAATPVTNEQYLSFVRSAGHPAPPHWPDATIPRGLERHPVTYVDWFDARAFCAWAGARLPTEAEWEKAARGTDGRIYPWGDDSPQPEDIVPSRHALPARANVGGGPKRGGTSAVDAHPGGASPYGLRDMAGNVWEWVSSAYATYPYSPADGREDPDTGAARVLRGGSYASPDARNIRCAARSRSAPGRRSPHIGFRIARDIAIDHATDDRSQP
jgi:formylglycine-generating enzyme required for sulfatase activity